MSTRTQRQPQRPPESPYPREDFWGDEAPEDVTAGHSEVRGTDPASYIAHQLLLELVDAPICARTLRERDEEVELSEPTFHLPKQNHDGTRFVEYRQFPHRRRVNKETGYINWGETTSTALPQVDRETYMEAVDMYLFERLRSETGDRVVLTDRELRIMESRRRRAKRLFGEQQRDSHSALEEFVRQVRDGDI